MKILNLTLSKKPFDVMVTGEKTTEYRRLSQWIKSRCFDSEGNPKYYDAVKFVNGYGADKPYFIAKYITASFAGGDFKKEYSNGLVVDVKFGDALIYLGDIIETGNLKT